MKNNIKYYRLKQGLTQSKLAELIGVNQNTISEYESGLYYPAMEIAIKLSEVLNVSINDLYKLK